MWFILALSAAALWGLDYSFSEQLYRHVSVLTSLAIGYIISAIVFSILAYYSSPFAHDLAAIHTSRVFWLLAITVAASILGSVFIAFSIADNNATLSGLIEISYPIFIALFAFLFFRENSLTLPTVIGALLIFSGVATVYVFNR